ncbi:MAG TPA: DUF6159 family protein [Mycobacteriales bacterium]|nr:DUF6159 family protein [Mycobacteriales bacterium]
MDLDYFATPGGASPQPSVPPAAPAVGSSNGWPAAPPATPVQSGPPPAQGAALPAQGTVLPAQQGWPAPPSTSLSADERMMLATSEATSYQNMTGGPSYYLPGSRLGFMGSIRVGFRLIPVCWSVLAQELVLLVVPLVVLLVGGLALLGYAAAFGGVDGLVTDNNVDTAIRLFPIAAFMMILSVLGQAVIVAGATDILNGHRSSLGTAWLTALNQFPRLAWFGVVYAGERTLTGMLRGRRGWSPTDLAADVIDRAWDFATFLAIPVLLYENVTVFQAVKRSGQLVKQRWGVQLTARSVLGTALFVAFLPLVVLAVLVAVGVSAVLGIVLILILLLGQVAMAGALTGVLSAALYRFGVTGLVAPGFQEADMWAAFDRR